MKKILLFIFVNVLLFNLSGGVLTVTNTNDIGAGSLRDAIATSSPGDTIRFDASLILAGNDTIKLASPISFTKNLTFKGLYNTTDTLFVSGNNTTQIFVCDLTASINKNLTIDSLCLINAKNNNGAVLNFIGDTLIIENCYVADNNTFTRNAGFEIDGHYVYVYNTSFINNISGSNAGAIGFDSDSANLIIESCDFLNNQGDFGAVSINNTGVASNPKVNIKHSNFQNNHALSRGGALYFAQSGSSNYSGIIDLTIDSSDFINNTADIDGGGIAIFNGDNSALYSYNKVKISYSNFLNNQSISTGGAIFINAQTKSFVDVSHSLFDRNSSSEGGAVIILNSASQFADSSSLIIDNCVFEKNEADNFGGAIFTFFQIEKSTLKITNSLLDSNYATGNTSYGRAGAIGTSSKLFIYNSVLKNNSAEIEGGCIYTNGMFMSVDSSLFINNFVGGTGGALFIGGGTDFFELDCNRSFFKSNSGVNNGGAIFAEVDSNSIINVSNSTFELNTANRGGAISNYTSYMSAETNVINSTFHNNLSLLEGASIFSSSDYSEIHIDIINSTFNNNSSSTGGGSIYSYSTIPSLSYTNVSSSIFNDTISVVNNLSPTVNSLGYNIFSESSITGSAGTDQLNIDSLTLNLGALQNNGGFTSTLMPNLGSVSINMGDPTNFTAAQNKPITDSRRDVGAAEYTCENSSSYNDSLCSGDSLLFNGVYLTVAGSYKDTLLNASSCDSIITLNLIVKTGCYVPVEDSCSGLIISEYIEGSSFNKAIEIYNASANSINLSQYTVKVYSNGSSSGTSILLSGTINSYGVYIVSHTSANATILGLANQTSGSLNFTGNDAVSLERNDTLIDLVGVIGFDPGTQWGSGTQNHTLVRKNSIKGGVKTNPVTFDPITEWDIYALDELSYLGTHTNDCSNTTSVKKENLAELISLYPNPTNGELFIETGLTESVEYLVYSINGKVITRGVVNTKGSINLLDIDNGVYFIKVKNGNKFTTERIVLTK